MVTLKTWTEELSVHNPLMDQQHQKLFELMNKLYYSADLSQDGVDDAIKGLLDYTHKHFGQEEEFLESIRYPHFDAHKEKHGYIFMAVDKLIADFSMMDHRLFANEVYVFISEWLVGHIIYEDMTYAKYIKDHPLGAGVLTIQYDPL